MHAELEVLADQPQPLARLLPRRPGQKEDRWQQLLATESGMTEGSPSAADAATDPVWQAVGDEVSSAGYCAPREPIDGDRSRAGLEDRVESLASEMAALQDQIAELTTSLNALRHGLGE